MLNWWPKARGALIGAALFFGGLSGVPEPDARVVGSLPQIVQQGVEVYRSVTAAVLRPVRFVPDLFQFTQEWRLFSSAADARFWMWIEAREGDADEWQLLYRPHDPAHAWMADAIEYRRMRGNWNPSRRGANRGYDGFVEWAAERAFADNPRLRAVRVRMEEIRLLPLGQGFAPTGRFLHERTRERGEASP